ncbi:MAG: sugar ABC transporter substrate-binding protein [Lachnospiraceae bacterium]|nr:sugar ABC transporter substrate-binding protein [Lachnospiraceae bacterium]
MKKKILSLVLSLSMVAALTACGSSAAPAAESAAPAESAAATEAAADTAASTDGATITYWYWADNTDYSQLMQDIIAKFNAENGKGITVVGEEYPWDGGAYSENVFNACMGGGGPDCASWKLTSTPSFVNNDLLLPLDDYVAGWDKKDDIDANLYDVMKSATEDGKMYVMPWNVQVLYVYYRPSLFEQAGITAVPKTYDELLEDIKKCTMDTDGDGKTDVYGWGMRGAKGGQEPWGCFVYGEGGTFEDLTTPEAVKGMQDFIDIYQNGYAPETATGDGFDQIIANFQNGTTAMTIHHTGSSKGMEELFGEDVDAFPMPAGKGQWTSMGDTDNVIMSSCENPDAAFEWISYLAAGEGQKMWCEGTGNVPVSKTVQEGDFFTSNRFMQASIEGQSFAGIIPIKDTTTEWISTVWPNTVAQALTGDITAEECMQTLQDALYQ